LSSIASRGGRTTHYLNLGISTLRFNISAIDVVELVVRELKIDPLLNSGRGFAPTAERTSEMEASIMDGHGRRCGAVSGLTTVKNPVMDKSHNSSLAFSPKSSLDNRVWSLSI
jgi:beta-aspartyl-peptidase (threonine type)